MNPEPATPTVVTRQPAVGASPLDGKTASFRTVEHQLMSDDTERYACIHTPDCDYWSTGIRSVISHQRIHTVARPHRPTNTDQMIAKARRAVKETRNLTDAADMLNSRGIRTALGHEWTATNLSKVLSDARRANIRRRASAGSLGGSGALATLVAALRDALPVLEQMVAVDLGQVQQWRDKAARFDAIQAAMGGKL